MPRSPALRAAAALGGSGLALAVGNLLLARVLATDEFAFFALFYALLMLGVNVGPCGADVILTRRAFNPGPRFHYQVLLTSGVTALVLLAVSKLLYPLTNALLAILFVAITAGGLNVVATAHYASRQKFGVALLLAASANITVFLAAVVTLATDANTAVLPALAVAVSLCLSASLGWRRPAADAGQSDAERGNRYPYFDGLAAVSFIGANILLVAMERLATPRLLGLHALATLGVLSTIAGSPFQMLQLGIGYTLVPALRNAGSITDRRHVFTREAAVAAAVSIASSVAVWYVTPVIVHFVLADRYSIGWPLLLASICHGQVKIAATLVAAPVNALGRSSDLVKLSTVGWVSIGVAVLGALAGSRWGLVGVVYGVACGWLLRTLIISCLAVPLLKLPAAEGRRTS